jgi:death-on-curing protein
MTRFITVDELVYINDLLIHGAGIHSIVEGKRAVRDMNLLESAAARPMQSVFGEDAYPTLSEKAAALLHSLARNHPFADGNKRTALLAALLMLAVNGQRPRWEAAEALQQVVAVAEGHADAPAFAAWLPLEAGSAAPDPDAAADMQLIQQLMDEHHWLLAELAKI